MLYSDQLVELTALPRPYSWVKGQSSQEGSSGEGKGEV